MAESSADRSAREQVLREFFALPTAEQLKAFRAIREYLGAEVGKETAADEQADRRGAALEAIRTAAEHLGIGEGESMTVAQFNKACQEVGSDWRSHRVIVAWQSWREAIAAPLGERVRESPAQRSIRRAARGRRRSHEDYLRGLREWLSAKPASRTALDYDEWVRARNDSGAEPKLVRSRALRNAFPYIWNDLLAIAEGRLDFFEARERASRVSGDHPFVSRGQLAALLGVSGPLVDPIAIKPDFPAVLAVISGTRAWDRGQVIAWRDGEPFEHEPQGSRQADVLGTAQLAAELGYAYKTIRAMLAQPEL